MTTNDLRFRLRKWNVWNIMGKYVPIKFSTDYSAFWAVSICDKIKKKRRLIERTQTPEWQEIFSLARVSKLLQLPSRCFFFLSSSTIPFSFPYRKRFECGTRDKRFIPFGNGDGNGIGNTMGSKLKMRKWEWELC